MKKAFLFLTILFWCVEAQATVLFLRDDAVNWTDAASWSNVSAVDNTNSGPPTAADDCIAELLSGNVTINSGAVARSFDTTSGTGSYAGTITHTAAITFTIGDATAGANNVAIKLNSGVTYTLGNATTSATTFASTSTTEQTVDYAGKTPGNLTFAGTAGVWAITSSISATSTTLTLTRGTLSMDGVSDNSGLSHTFNIFAGSTTTTRVLTLGTSTVTLSGTNAFSVTDNTGFTINAGTSSIVMSAASAVFNCGNGGGFNAKTFYSVSWTGGGTMNYANAVNHSFTNLTITGTASKTNNFVLDGNMTITGTVNFNGNSSVNRPIIRSGTLGTARTITFNGATNPNTTISNADFRDITVAGSFGAWGLSAITGLSGDAGGNTNITFTTPATQTATGSSANWSTASWSGRVPLPQDDAVLSLTAGQTLTNDMPRMGKSISVTTAMNLTLTTVPTIYGSLNLTNVSTFTASAITFEGRGAFNLTSNGKSFTSNPAIAMVGGSLTLLDAASFGASSPDFTMTNGTFDANDFNITIARQFAPSTGTTTNMGNGTWTLNRASSTVFTGGGTVNAEGSTILISDTGASSKTFAGGGKNYNDLKVNGGGAGAIIITGANTLNRLYTDGGGTKPITLPGSTNTTILSDAGLENGTHLITFTSSAGTATVVNASGHLEWNKVSLTSIASSGSGTCVATHSVNGAGNTNWLFQSNQPFMATT